MKTAIAILSVILSFCIPLFLWRMDNMMLSNYKEYKSYNINVNSHELYKFLADLPDKCKKLNPFVQCKITLKNDIFSFKDISKNDTDIFVFCKENCQTCDFTRIKRKNIKITDLNDTCFVAYKTKRIGQANDWILALILDSFQSHCKNNEIHDIIK